MTTRTWGRNVPSPGVGQMPGLLGSDWTNESQPPEVWEDTCPVWAHPAVTCDHRRSNAALWLAGASQICPLIGWPSYTQTSSVVSNNNRHRWLVGQSPRVWGVCHSGHRAIIRLYQFAGINCVQSEIGCWHENNAIKLDIFSGGSMNVRGFDDVDSSSDINNFLVIQY